MPVQVEAGCPSGLRAHPADQHNHYSRRLISVSVPAHLCLVGINLRDTLPDRREAIRRVLYHFAVEERTVTYGELGKQVGLLARGPWKRVLDAIGAEEAANWRPDTTYIAVNKRTGIPSQVD